MRLNPAPLVPVLFAPNMHNLVNSRAQFILQHLLVHGHVHTYLHVYLVGNTCTTPIHWRSFNHAHTVHILTLQAHTEHSDGIPLAPVLPFWDPGFRAIFANRQVITISFLGASLARIRFRGLCLDMLYAFVPGLNNVEHEPSSCACGTLSPPRRYGIPKLFAQFHAAAASIGRIGGVCVIEEPSERRHAKFVECLCVCALFVYSRVLLSNACGDLLLIFGWY